MLARVGFGLNGWAYNIPLVHAARRPQTAAFAEKTVAPNGNGRVAGRGGRRGARDSGAREIAADHGVGHDDGLAAEHDVLGADEGGFARDLVAGVGLDVLASRRSSRHGGLTGWSQEADAITRFGGWTSVSNETCSQERAGGGGLQGTLRCTHVPNKNVN